MRRAIKKRERLGGMSLCDKLKIKLRIIESNMPGYRSMCVMKLYKIMCKIRIIVIMLKNVWMNCRYSRMMSDMDILISVQECLLIAAMCGCLFTIRAVKVTVGEMLFDRSY